jgi:hypothetical protein
VSGIRFEIKGKVSNLGQGIEIVHTDSFLLKVMVSDVRQC